MTYRVINSLWQAVDWPTLIAGRRWVLCCDPPYSARTHAGRRTGSEVRQSSIGYAPLTLMDVVEVVEYFRRLGPSWWVFFGDDETVQWWKRALAQAKQYTFRPLPWVKPDAPPRMSGDGPASSVEEIEVACAEEPDEHVDRIQVARWRHHPARKFSRPGYYIEETASARGNGKARPGRKPLTLMRKLLLDYSEPGDLVLDIFCGEGTTLIAAEIEGRDSIGCDVDAAACAVAESELAALVRQPQLPSVQRLVASQMKNSLWTEAKGGGDGN